MKTKTKRQESPQLPRFVVGALAAAGASAANGATVQITFNGTSPGNYVSFADGAANFDGALTGYDAVFPSEGWKGDPLAPSIANNGITLKLPLHVSSNYASVFGNNGSGFVSIGGSTELNGFKGKAANTYTVERLVPFRFADSRLNGGVERLGWLHLELTGAKVALKNSWEIEIKRLIFDDESLSAPTFVGVGDFPYPEMVFSPVPEPGSNLALLALGAGGLTLRRRLKRAA